MVNYHFGVEIEVLVEPHKIRNPLNSNYALYYSKLAASLRKRGLKAKADDLVSGYSKRPEHYDKWWITKDGSLGNPEDKIPMEAVSPILACFDDWEGEIDTFWTAMRVVFHMPERSRLCGSHIHISPGQGSSFTLSQLKTIAYGVVVYERLVLELLMPNRASNGYCKPNTINSSQLRANGSNLTAIAQLISSANNTTVLMDIMQDNRYVLWNFGNIVPGKSGTVEFRGGRCLRGEVRTKRWIAFTIAFIDFILSTINIASPLAATLQSPAGLYAAVVRASLRLSLRNCLPNDYRVLNESQSA